MRGRRRKPTQAKILHGTFRQDRANLNEPRPEPLKDLEPPAWLDGYAQECWKAHVPWLLKLGVITSIDVSLFAAVCERWSTYRRACDDLKDGLTHTTTANGECAKPQVAIAKAAFDSFKSGLQEFGCSPATRGKVSAARPPDDDPVAAYFFEGKPKTGAARFLA